MLLVSRRPSLIESVQFPAHLDLLKSVVTSQICQFLSLQAFKVSED